MESMLSEKKCEPDQQYCPGSYGAEGMESLEIIHGIIDETKPDLVIVIDALAARSTKRLNRTIQVTDTGINPGSGVGNHRHGLNKKKPWDSRDINRDTDSCGCCNDRQ